MSAAPKWKQDRSRLHAVVGAISRDDTATALALLYELEAEAFDGGDPYAGEIAYARYRLAGRDPVGACDIVQRLLERRYR